MIAVTHGIKVFVCTQPTDMRRSFDGLCGMVDQLIRQDPLSGHLFVFRNRNRDRLKILYWDSDGLAIWYKRLEDGTYQFPTDLKEQREALKKNPQGGVEISSSELSLLLGGIDLSSVHQRKRFQRSKKPR
jgi:transposase